MYRFFQVVSLFIIFFVFLKATPVVFANTLGTVSDTITTSRPSPSTPLNGKPNSGVGNVTVFNNGSTFLASDSATLWGGTVESLTVATVSADKTNLFFTSTLGQNNHAAGSVVTSAVTAMHTIKFNTGTDIPTSGSIVIQFPSSSSSDTNQASPSASTFMPNGLASGNIKTNQSNLSCSLNSFSAGNAPTITCNNSTADIAPTTILIFIGCSATTGSGSSMTCSTQVPTLINPTKSAQAGTADTWTVSVNTFSAASGTGTILDNAKIKVGTVESVNVVAHIDPTFTFTISGVGGSVALNTVCTNGGNNPDTTDNDFPTTSTDVNLGTLTAATIAHKAQKFVLTSNAISGYSITATSSGHLINPANGYYIQDAQGTPTANDTPTPNGATATITAGANRFGIHPCELTAQNKLNTTTWGGSTPLYANPSASFYYTLVNSSTAPASNGDTFYVEYSASPAGSSPPGDYHTTLTYVATAVF